MARFAADLVVVVHLAFVAFAVLGGLLALRWPKIAWVHLPAVAWAAYAELTGTICPLTPLENALRVRGGLAGYEGDFIGRYLLPILYPEGLTPAIQVWLGLTLIGINAVAYLFVWRRARRRSAR